MPPRLTRLAALIILSTAACSGSDSHPAAHSHSGPSSIDLAIPETGKGVQYAMTSTLIPGQEIERCRFFQVPPEGYYVNSEEIRFTAGSHHVLLYTTPYTSIPTQDRDGTPVDTSGVFDCGVRGPTAHWEVDGVAGGSQVATQQSGVTDLPPDTAIHLPGGRVLLMNTHYLNASDKMLTTDARINLYTLPAANVKQEAGVIFFYNPFIRVQPKSKGGAGEAREVCPVLSDVTLVNAQSHMHRRGVSYQANLLDAGGAVVDELYRGTEWQQVVMRQFPGGKTLHAGQAIDYRCGYSNPEERTVMQGLATTDEMCMFLGAYYPRNRQFELCGLDATWDNAFLGARWIGNGTADGPTTAECLLGAKETEDDKGDSFYGCVVNSCPKISAAMSAAATCEADRGGASCTSVCDDVRSVACRLCVGVACVGQMDALRAAKCD